MESAPNGFLDVNRLLETSVPRPQVNLTWWLGGLVLVLLLITAIIDRQSVAGKAVVAVLSIVGMVVLIGGVSLISVFTVKRFRSEQQQIELLGEMVQLRRWQDAAVALDRYLSHPSRTHSFRAQALLYLSSVLARLRRFDDALAVQNALLEEGMLDPNSAATVRIGRAMAMLQADHLFDADRAINELRRGPLAGSGPLALVEIYRDVKTGHPQEAIEIFEQKQTIIRAQLGHRLGDAYALVARAYDLLGRTDDAAAAFRKATLLAPISELLRRYPEVQKLEGRYQPAPAPPEAA